MSRKKFIKKFFYEKKSVDILSHICYNLSVERRKTLSIFKIKMKSTNKQESYEAALTEAILVRERGFMGFGEIVDKGQKSKNELLELYHQYLSQDGIENLVKEALHVQEVYASFFDEDDSMKSEEELKVYYMNLSKTIKEFIDKAPDEHIYDFQYIC